jgi:hypothetical protein
LLDVRVTGSATGENEVMDGYSYTPGAKLTGLALSLAEQIPREAESMSRMEDLVRRTNANSMI